MLVAVGTVCGEPPKPKTAGTPMDRVMAENQQAAVALVQARKLGDQVHEAAESIKTLFDGTVGGGGAGDARE
jgi:AAA+ superfamily predicted ATPase